MPSLPDPSQATSSPKRKRSPIPPTPPSSSPTNTNTNTMRLNTCLPYPKDRDEGMAGSPRTKVSYHFEGLQLEDRLGEPMHPMPRLDFQTSKPNLQTSEYSDEEQTLRKRIKMLKEARETPHDLEIPETPDVRAKTVQRNAYTITMPPSRAVDPIIAEKASKVILHNNMDPVLFTSGGSPLSKIKASASGLTRSYPSIDRLADSKSRSSKKRVGTPPLSEDTLIIDPERAAQTWHDDEITGHDPTDPDDDGEGINGIGFKPTAAEAYARTQKRKLQMEQYRSREAREARARRSERRRGGSDGVGMEGGDVEKERKVRFEEGSVVVTT